MALEEFKSAVDKLPVQERLELIDYIRHSFSGGEVPEQDEVTRRLRHHLEDQGHTDDTLQTLHDWYLGNRK
jgi:hypothetical protein